MYIHTNAKLWGHPNPRMKQRKERKMEKEIREFTIPIHVTFSEKLTIITPHKNARIQITYSLFILLIINP